MEDMAHLFDPAALSFPLDQIQPKLQYLEHSFVALGNDVEKIMSPVIVSPEEMSIRCSRLNWYLEEVLKRRTPDFYFFIRGALRHFMCAGFAHTFAMSEREQQMLYIRQWQDATMQFFKQLPDHFRSVVFKKFDLDTDPWVRQAIVDPEDGINPFFTEPLDDLQLEF
jgi:hypothetical protein